jgi:hypothetical protein
MISKELMKKITDETKDLESLQFCMNFLSYDHRRMTFGSFIAIETPDGEIRFFLDEKDVPIIKKFVESRMDCRKAILKELNAQAAKEAQEE